MKNAPRAERRRVYEPANAGGKTNSRSVSESAKRANETSGKRMNKSRNPVENGGDRIAPF